MTRKTDHLSLYEPGLHNIKQDEIQAIFQNPFNSNTRERLTTGLLALLATLEPFDIVREVWIDGSYSTEKPDPADVDLLFVLDVSKFNALSTSIQDRIKLTLDNAIAKVRYNCDVYYIPDNSEIDAAYWRGQYGFCHDRKTAKGIPRVVYEPHC